MLWLALETSTGLGGVGVAEDGSLLAESLFSVRATHSETVLPEVERLLAAAGRERAEIGAVVAGAGPGSFTGVRIAASLAKGLCFALDVPLYAFSSLLATAAGTGLRERVCVLFDARRGEVYGAAYGELDPPAAVVEPSAEPVEAFLDRLPEPASWSFVGEGATRHAEAIASRGGRSLPEHLGHPRAASLLWLARRWPDRGRVPEPAAWEPGYVRPSGARRALERS